MSEDSAASALARELREAREALLALVADLPETRLARATEQAGWTVRHELAHLAGADAELLRLLERLRRGVSETTAPELRRFRGEAMHAAQELRLGALREHLAASGHRAATALETHAALFERPLTLGGREATTLAQYARDHAARARAGLEAIRRAIG